MSDRRAEVIRRFLGVEIEDGPAAILGLERAPGSVVEVESAMGRRLAAIFEHPEGRSEAADEARRIIRQAAEVLRRRLGAGDGGDVRRGGRADARPVALTEFDRSVLAILVGCGGWNARSRSYLTALASTHGVSTQGLMRVIRGLGGHARSGRRVGVGEITGGLPVRSFPSVPIERRTTLLEQAVERASVELKEPSLGVTVRLSALFGLLAILAGIILIRILIAEPAPTGGRPDSVPATETTPAGGGPSAPGAASVSTERPSLRLELERPPGFERPPLPPVVADAADASAAHPERLDRAARRLRIPGPPPEPLYRGWIETIDTVATGWPLIEPAVRGRIEDRLGDVLYAAADRAEVVGRLLEPLRPPLLPVAEPLDLVRGAWLSGMAGRVAADASLPPAARQRAAALLADAGLPSAVTEAGGGPGPAFETAVFAWLRAALLPMVREVEFDGALAERWGLWLACLDRAGRMSDRAAAERQTILMDAVGRLAAASVDLARGGPALDVVTTLLRAADLESSEPARRGFARLAELESVTASDLWAITSVLHQYVRPGWFTESLVIPPDSDPPAMARRLDRIVRRHWPRPEPVVVRTGRATAVDPALLATWKDLVDLQMGIEPPGGELALLELLVDAARLSAAAGALAADDVPGMRTALQGHGEDVGSGSGAGGRGGPVRPDGIWAAAYREDARTETERMNLLDGLDADGGRDLGPIDASVFTTIVYRGRTAALRTRAAEILQNRYRGAPTVALAMLDELPAAPAGRAVGAVVSGYANVLLPEIGSPSWPAAARLALLRHALSLRPGPAGSIDEAATALAGVYAMRAARVAGSVAGTVGGASTTDRPEVAAEALLDAWNDRCAAAMATEPVPEDLEGLERRHRTRLQLQSGPVQLFVARQTAILEGLAYVVAAEQPSAAAEVRRLLLDAAEQRLAAPRSLEQALIVERAMLRLWDLRMIARPAEETS